MPPARKSITWYPCETAELDLAEARLVRLKGVQLNFMYPSVRLEAASTRMHKEVMGTTGRFPGHL